MPPRGNKPTMRRHRGAGNGALLSAQSRSHYRVVLLAICAGYFVQKNFKYHIMPYGGPALQPYDLRPTLGRMDWSNDQLRLRHGRSSKIGVRNDDASRLFGGPETVVVGNKDGALYVLSEHAQLLQLINLRDEDDDAVPPSRFNQTAEVKLLHSVGIGRPLGGAFTPDGKTLYIADAVLGLTRIINVHDPKSKVEILVSSVQREDGTTSPIRFADDVAIGRKTGKVYFTDATDIAPERYRRYHNESHWSFEWGTLYASKVDLVRGASRGRLLAYDPSTDTTSVLATGLKFANGIAVDDKDEAYVVFVQTFAPAVSVYHLKGPNKGTVQPLVPSSKLTGYPDGLDCYGETCWTVLISAISLIHKVLLYMPEILDAFLRTLLLNLPRWLAPPVKTYGAIVQIHVPSGKVTYIQDPHGHDFAMLSGVTHHNGKLYLGSLTNDYIGVYELESI